MKKVLTITFVAVFCLAAVNVAFAVAGNGNTVKEEVKEKVAAIRAERAIAKCEIVESRVEKRITNFDKNRENHVTSYNKTKEKIQSLITKLDGKDYDTAKLKTDLVEFDAKIKTFTEDYAKYVSLLSETKQFTCGKNEGDFKTKLAAAREQLKVVHKDAVEIRTFYAKTIRPDVLAIKEQNPKTTTETNETDSEN